MKKIGIEKIVVKDNIRKDYGNLTELVASIKQHGIRKPIELNRNNELVDGHRRIKVVKLINKQGLKTITNIPFFYSDEKVDKTTSQILSGIFHKNLNPIEEGKAFKKYMSKNNISQEQFSKIISKDKNYIEKRIVLIDLHPDVQEALINKKIQLGHALLLAKLPKGEGLKYLREIIREKYSVSKASEDLKYSNRTLDLSTAPFDKTQCKGCKFNGSEQTILFETGTVLNGKCLNHGCFNKKFKEGFRKLKEKYKDVLVDERKQIPVDYVNSEYVWDAKEKGITAAYKMKCRKKKENYLVRINEYTGKVEEYFKSPESKRKPTKDKSLGKVRKEKLLSRVTDFKRTFLIDKSKVLLKAGSIPTKVLSLVRLINTTEYSLREEGITEIKKILGSLDLKKILNASDKNLDKAIAAMSKLQLYNFDMIELITMSRAFGVDVKKHFKITKDFLNLFTKDQLKDLIKELKISKNADWKKISKKQDYVDYILKQNPKNLPKIIL